MLVHMGLVPAPDGKSRLFLYLCPRPWWQQALSLGAFNWVIPAHLGVCGAGHQPGAPLTG